MSATCTSNPLVSLVTAAIAKAPTGGLPVDPTAMAVTTYEVSGSLVYPPPIASRKSTLADEGKNELPSITALPANIIDWFPVAVMVCGPGTHGPGTIAVGPTSSSWARHRNI